MKGAVGMLTELCQELRNWFPVRKKNGDAVSYPGTYTITGGVLTADFMARGQYFRITGSLFNDGVHRNDQTDILTDETFDGTVWPMAVPKAVIDLAAEIAAWRTKYEASDSAALSPFASESFGGYSYSKASGGAGASAPSWRTTFSSRMNAWRKL